MKSKWCATCVVGLVLVNLISSVSFADEPVDEPLMTNLLEAPLIEAQKELFRKKVANLREKALATYVGRERQIDQILNAVEGWMLNPELRVRPTVINLWGMTGTGKTSLAKMIVQELDLQGESSYIDLARYSMDETPLDRIEDVLAERYLGSSVIEDLIRVPILEQPRNPVLIFDEVQKVYTRNPDGTPHERPHASAFFELLGNGGRLQVSNPTSELVQAMKQTGETPKIAMTEEEFEEYQKNPRFQKRFDDRVAVVVDQLAEETPATIDLNFSSALIFTAGNLDHVFPSANEFGSEDVDADELAAKTKKITEAKVTKGLGEIFRPEHVSRFGGRHVVFQSLSKVEYEELIRRRVKEFEKEVWKKFELWVRVEPNILQRIYDEGVYPAMGTRTVEAMVDRVLRESIARVIPKVEEMRKGPPGRRLVNVTAQVRVSDQDSLLAEWLLESRYGNHSVYVSLPSESVRSRQPLEGVRGQIAALDVAASTVLAMKLRGKLPLEAKLRSRANPDEGLVRLESDPVDSVYYRQDYINFIALDLAHFAAEEWLLGEANLEAMDGLKYASQSAVQLVAKGGGYLKGKDRKLASLIAAEVKPLVRERINSEVEAVLEEARALVVDTLRGEWDFFQALRAHLEVHPTVSRKELLILAQEHWKERSDLPYWNTGTRPPTHCERLLEAARNGTQPPPPVRTRKGSMGL